MHQKLKALQRVNDLCMDTDVLASSCGLREMASSARRNPWGCTDLFAPAQRTKSVHQIEFTRDVFLNPDSNTENEYQLGLEEDYLIKDDGVYLAFRVSYQHESNAGTDMPQFEDFPVTVFYEAVGRRWMISAKERFNGKGRRPRVWQDLLKSYGLAEAGELAMPIRGRTALRRISAMMRLTADQAGQPKRLKVE